MKACVFFLTLALTSVSCTPKIYVIDRQTIFEVEAAGQWPQFEKELLERSKAQGPTPLSKVPRSARREKLLNVLNGPLVTESAKRAQ